MQTFIPLAAGIADVADYLGEIAPLIGALSSVALGITGAYLILYHTKKGANAAAGCEWQDWASPEGPAYGEDSPFKMPADGWSLDDPDGVCDYGGFERELAAGGAMSPFQLPEGYLGDPVDSEGDSYASGMRLITGPECLTAEEREWAANDDGSAHAGEIWDCEYCGADFPSEAFYGAGKQCPSCGHA